MKVLMDETQSMDKKRKIKTLSGKEVEIRSPSTELYEKEHEAAKKDISTICSKLAIIEEKNRCLRVKFLDWLAAKLISWSKSIQKMAADIDSPCIIKIPTKKENEKISIRAFSKE